MSVIEKINLLVESLPNTCLYCRYGFPVVYGIESWLDVFVCGAHVLDNPKTKKVTLRITRSNANREENKGAVGYAPLLNADEGCNKWKPVKPMSRKFKLLDVFHYFDDE